MCKDDQGDADGIDEYLVHLSCKNSGVASYRVRNELR